MTRYTHGMYALHAVALAFGALLAVVWDLHRVIRGWLALGSGKTIYG